MTKIKICGLSRPEDIDYVNEACPDYCGFVIGVPSSRRNVSVETLYCLRRRLSGAVKAVGVFVNAEAELPARLLQDGVISAAQLHGQEDEAYIRRLRERSGGKIIKAFSVEAGRTWREHLQAARIWCFWTTEKGGRERLLTGGCWKPAAEKQRNRSFWRRTESGKYPGGGSKIQAIRRGSEQCGRDGRKKGQRENIGSSGCGKEYGEMKKGRYGIHGGQYIPRH